MGKNEMILADIIGIKSKNIRESGGEYIAQKNYLFSCFPDEEIDEFCEGDNALCEKLECDGMILYKVTPQGIKWLEKKLGIKIII